MQRRRFGQPDGNAPACVIYQALTRALVGLRLGGIFLSFLVADLVRYGRGATDQPLVSLRDARE